MLRINGIFWSVRWNDFVCRVRGHDWLGTVAQWDPDVYARCSRCGIWRSK